MACDALGPSTKDFLPRQGEPGADIPVQLGEVVVDADVWGVSDLRLRHGEASPWGCDSNLGRQSDSVSSAHCGLAIEVFMHLPAPAHW